MLKATEFTLNTPKRTRSALPSRNSSTPIPTRHSKMSKATNFTFDNSPGRGLWRSTASLLGRNACGKGTVVWALCPALHLTRQVLERRPPYFYDTNHGWISHSHLTTDFRDKKTVTNKGSSTQQHHFFPTITLMTTNLRLWFIVLQFDTADWKKRSETFCLATYKGQWNTMLLLWLYLDQLAGAYNPIRTSPEKSMMPLLLSTILLSIRPSVWFSCRRLTKKKATHITMQKTR